LEGRRRTLARRWARKCVHGINIDHEKGKPLLVSSRTVGRVRFKLRRWPCFSLGLHLGQMVRVEDLRRAVMDTVISDRPMVPVDEIVALIAPWLEMEATSLVLRHVAPLVFILARPLMEMVAPLVDRRPLLCAATFSIACKRWCRFVGSTGGILPTFL
jgi:hypothetical protein